VTRAAAALAALAAWASCAAPAAALDLAAGLGLDASYSAAYGALIGAAARPDRASLAAEPALIASGDSWEARLAAGFRASTDPADAQASLAEARARLWLGDYLSLSAGYGLESGAAAELFPQTAFLGPSDPLSRLESGGGTERRSPEASAELRASASWWRLTLACAPFRPELVLPDLDSPWFPRSAVPSSFSIGSTLPYRRSSLAYAEGAEEGGSFEPEPSYIAKAGASLGPFELDLAFFRGRERQAVLSGAMELESLDTYSVTLEPHRALVSVLAFSATAVSGPWRLWTEDSFTWGASLATGSVDSESWPLKEGWYFDLDSGEGDFSTDVPPVVQRDRVACTLGASYAPELAALSLGAFVEGTWSWFLDEPEGCEAPALSRAAAGGATLGGLAGGLSLTLSGLVSLADGSAALRPSASLALGGDRSVELAAPIFLGSEGTELGDYRGMYYATLSYSQKL